MPWNLQSYIYTYDKDGSPVQVEVEFTITALCGTISGSPNSTSFRIEVLVDEAFPQSADRWPVGTLFPVFYNKKVTTYDNSTGTSVTNERVETTAVTDHILVNPRVSHTETCHEDLPNGYRTTEYTLLPQTDFDATINVTDVICNGTNTGAVSVTVTGSSGYTYKWSDGSTQKDRVNMYAGNYTLIITDIAGLAKSYNVVITQPTRIEITTIISGMDVSASATGGTAPYDFIWADGFIGPDRVDLVPGDYLLTVQDANLCTQSVTVTITDFRFYFSENPVWLQLQADAPETKANLSFLADVYIEDDYNTDTFLKKYSAEHPAKSDGTTYFDFREVLNAYLNASLPEFGESIVVLESGSFKRFYIQHTEKYGEPPVPGAFTQIDTFYVLMGGLSEQEHAKYTFFISFLDTQKPFLSWQPTAKEVLEAQHEYLSYVVFQGSTTQLKLKALISYTDDTQLEVDLLTQNTVQPFEVYRFPAGYTQLALADQNPAKTVKSYTLWLTDQADAVISEERTYEIIEDETFYRSFLYLNSLGRWDTLLAKGRGSSKLKTSDEVIDRELPVNYKYSDREQVVTSKTGQIDSDVVIGNLTNDERKHLQDLAISTQVYEITPSGYLPVQVKMNFDPHDDLNQMDEISMAVMPPITRKYTPEL